MKPSGQTNRFWTITLIFLSSILFLLVMLIGLTTGPRPSQAAESDSSERQAELQNTAAINPVFATMTAMNIQFTPPSGGRNELMQTLLATYNLGSFGNMSTLYALSTELFDRPSIDELMQTVTAMGIDISNFDETMQAIYGGTLPINSNPFAYASPTRPSTATPTSTRAPLTLSVPEDFQNSQWQPRMELFDDIQMMLVPAGCFRMGQGTEVHTVCIENPFWMDRYEVSVKVYGSAGTETLPDRPRNQVTWTEAVAFCESRGGRLPTEAEWEFAARGPESFQFGWGNEFDERQANFCDSRCDLEGRDPNSDDGYGDMAAVTRYPDGFSWVGVQNLSGNVAEWTSSLDRPYPYDGTDGRENVDDLTGPRIVRGGSWADPQTALVASARESQPPDTANERIGFRCVRDYE